VPLKVALPNSLETLLDVRDLPPPEPFERALEAARQLGPQARLRLLHWREPYPLYGVLAREGFRHEVVAVDGRYEILVWRESSSRGG
jgi:hypothetical protein